MPVSMRLAHALAARHVLGEDGAAEAEVGIVGQRDSLFLVLDAKEQRHRAEELLAKRRVARLDVGQDRGPHERARAINALAAHHHPGAVGHGTVDLLQQADQGRLRGQRAQRGFFVQRVAGLQCAQRGLELLEELVGELVGHDEALGGTAGLAGVVHPAPDRPLDGRLQVGVVQHDERVAATQLHRRDLEILPGAGCHALAGLDAAGQGHAFDARVIDHTIGLRMRDQKVGVKTGGRAGFDPELLEGNRALRHDAGVLDHQHVARHQVRPRDAGQLVVRKIPRLDTEDHADRAAFHVRLAVVGCSFCGARKRSAFLA